MKSKRRSPAVKIHCEHNDPVKAPKLVRQTKAGPECVKCYSFLETDNGKATD